MRYLVVAALLAAASISSAHAQTGRVSGAYVGCLTKKGLDEIITAATKNDMRHMQALLGSECFPIKGREFSVVDRGFLKSQIRVYAGGGSVLLWTVNEATR